MWENIKGFSLIELMVVITIVAILATVGLVIYSKSQESARIAFTKENLSRLAQSVTLYRIYNDVFPPIGEPPCLICLTDNDARADFIRTHLLSTLASSSDGGPYIDSVEKFVFDGWGSAITYGVPLNPEDRILCSYGPNKQWNSGPWNPGSDDICVISPPENP